MQNDTIIFRSLQAIILRHGVDCVVLTSAAQSIGRQADKRTKSPHLCSVPAVRSGGVTETKTQLCHFITVHLSLSLSHPEPVRELEPSQPSSPPIPLSSLPLGSEQYMRLILANFFQPGRIRPMLAITVHYTH